MANVFLMSISMALKLNKSRCIIMHKKNILFIPLRIFASGVVKHYFIDEAGYRQATEIKMFKWWSDGNNQVFKKHNGELDMNSGLERALLHTQKKLMERSRVRALRLGRDKSSLINIFMN
uniref:Uncharacterized protein n=1 Tax=Glossina pallidipes TaxID=7398 RepID=A0A1A9Z776_GLOPL